MSLRGRLWLIIGLAAATLVVAVLSVLHALGSTDTARLQSANAVTTQTASALAQAFSTLHAESIQSVGGAALLKQSTAVIATALPDTHLGYCTRTGELLAVAARGRMGELQPLPKPLPPDQRAAVVEACRKGSNHLVIEHPADSVLISTAPVAPDGRAWVLRRVESRNNEDPWAVYVAVLSAATAILVGATVTTMVALSRGVRQVRRIVQQLRGDLRAPVIAPRETEFVSLTDSLVEMSRHLADANARESVLQRDLNHRERLAGLGRVVAGVAHEIRNPLAGLKLRLDVMIRANGLTESVGSDVRACLEDVARLDRVVQSLLVVSRKADTNTRRQDFGVLVEERIAALTETARSRISFDRNGPYEADVDRDGFIRVIDNLLRNALEASAPNGTLEVSLRSDAEWLTVTVADSGPGVPEHALPKLFEPFFTTKPDGTGLGLWLSRALLEAAGGTLSYERTNGETIFRARLPRQEHSH